MTTIHAFDPDGTASPGAQTALNAATAGLATQTYADQKASDAVASIPGATATNAGLMDTASVARLAAPGVYATDFGAVGDGVTDDSAALNAACAAAQGGVLHLTAGAVYSIKAKVLLSDGITVEGHGATLAKPADSTDNLALVKGTPAGHTGYGSGGRGITVRDLTIQGNYAAPAGYGDATSAFHHASELTIERCTFTQGVRNGHYLDLCGCSDVQVRASVFEGANPDSGREYIEAIQIDTSSYSALSDKTENANTLDGLPTRDVLVTGCTFKTLTLTGTEYPMPAAIGNHSCALTTDAGYYRNITFTENTLTGWMRDTTSFWAGWVHFAGVHTAMIARNTFTYTGSSPVQRGVLYLPRADKAIAEADLAAPSPTAVSVDRPNMHVTVQGNTFNGFGAYFATTAYRNGHGIIRVSGGSTPVGIKIIGNSIPACNSDAISLEGNATSPLIVSENALGGPLRAVSTMVIASSNAINAPSLTDAAGVDTAGTSAFVQIVGNNVSGFTRGIAVLSADNGLVQSNFVQGYTVCGIQVGQASGGNAYDVTVSGNRIRSAARTADTKSLSILATGTRTFSFGNRTRDGGDTADGGTGTITTATNAA